MSGRHGKYGIQGRPSRSKDAQQRFTTNRTERFAISKAEGRIGVRGWKPNAIRMNFAALYRMRGALRAALAGSTRTQVTVYDAGGKPIATMDPETRERKPL